MKLFVLVLSLILSFVLTLLNGCSSTPEVKTQAYAKLSNERTYEYDFPTVWKGIEEAVRKYKVTSRDPSEVDDLEMKKLAQRDLETGWIYGQSRDKYIEYQVNGSPRKTYLQTRFRYLVTAKSQIGGVTVTVKTKEEIEKLNSDGSPAGYSSVSGVDTSRPSELLDKIKIAILSAAP
jgi:hypothetical protein